MKTADRIFARIVVNYFHIKIKVIININYPGHDKSIIYTLLRMDKQGMGLLTENNHKFYCPIELLKIIKQPCVK